MGLSDFFLGKKAKKQKVNRGNLQSYNWLFGANPISTPLGNVTYERLPDGRIATKLNYSDAQQGLLEGSQGVSSSANALAQQLLAGMPAGAQSVEDSIYGQGASRLDPQWAEQMQLLQNRLYGQGLVEGSEAWKREMDDFARRRTDAYQTLLNNARMGRDQSLATQTGVVGNLAGVGRPVDLGNAPQNFINAGQVADQEMGVNAANANRQRQGGALGPLLGLGSSVLGNWAYGGFA
jgi:hypothetical protein